MKYINIILLFILMSAQSIAQNLDFTLADPQPNIFEVYSGTATLGDLDNDGDIDLVQSGLGENLTGQSAKVSVFLNDGAGNFTLTVQNFNNFFTTEVVVMGDLDNDDDLDLIVSGGNRTDFYRNDGQAVFTHDPGAPFEPADAGESIIGDVDGDGDNDVIQYGSTNQSNPFTKLFLNDGSGNFTLASGTSFVPYLNARIEYIDLEGDGDIDVLSFGENEAGEAAMSIYKNDGQGIFAPVIGSNVTPHKAEEISVGDIDNDGDEDFLISGFSNNSEPSTLLYLNDGSGQFSSLSNSIFPDVFASSNAFADLDNDNDLDILLIGSLAGGLPNIYSIVFENLGNNNFVAADSLGGEYIPANGIADLNGDGKKDILIQGFVDDTNVYFNNTDLSTGLKEALTVNINVFPNPSTNYLNIGIENNKIEAVEIIDVNGRQLNNHSMNQNSIDVSNLPTGIYLLRIHAEKEVYVQKFVKK